MFLARLFPSFYFCPRKDISDILVVLESDVMSHFMAKRDVRVSGVDLEFRIGLQLSEHINTI